MNLLSNIAVAVALTGALAPAFAATNTALADAKREYQKERAHCKSNQSHQDRATCLKEAANAYSEAKRGALANKGGSDFSANAVARCDAQPAADRQACVQRITGAGKVEGSVKGGGIIRETETTVR